MDKRRNKRTLIWHCFALFNIIMKYPLHIPEFNKRSISGRLQEDIGWYLLRFLFKFHPLI